MLGRANQRRGPELAFFLQILIPLQNGLHDQASVFSREQVALDGAGKGVCLAVYSARIPLDQAALVRMK